MHDSEGFAYELGTLSLVLPHRQLRSFCSAPEHLWWLLCCGIGWTLLQFLVLCPFVPSFSFMTTPPPRAATAVLERTLTPRPPEQAVLAADVPVNPASGIQETQAVLPAPSAVPPAASSTVSTARFVLNPVGAKLPLSFIPVLSPQPRVLPSPMGTKVAPSTPVQQLAKATYRGARQPTPPSAAPKTPQITTVQLPANFQIPQGMVLVRSNTGQLMLVSQQALLQAQSQASDSPSVRCSTPPNVSAVKIQPVQNSGTQVLKVLTAPVKTMSWTTNSVTATVKKPAVVQSISSATTTKSLFTGSSAKLPISDSSILALTSKTGGPTVTQAISCAEMLENVKKCKNFLATLIKLASSGPQAPQMGQNVKNLVQSLLEAKIEPEEFTKELYVELKSSPQPYLVPFLKKSLLALRQFMPNTETFIQQCLQQPVPQTAASTFPTALPTSSTMTDSIPVSMISLQSARPSSSPPLQIPPSQTSVPVPCATVTRGSEALPFAQPTCALAAGLSFRDGNPVSSTPLAREIRTMKNVQLASTTVEAVVGASAQVVKPDCAPAASSLSSMKSATSAVTSLEAAKLVLTTTSASATSVTTTLQPVVPITGAPITIRVAHPNSVLPQSIRTSQAVKVKPMVIQQPSGSNLKNVTKLHQVSTLPVMKKLCEKIPLTAFMQTRHLPAGSIVKQITLPGNSILSLQASPVERNKRRESGTTSFREEDDINDVASMAGVNLNEENACIFTTDSEAVSTVIWSCPEELLLSSEALQKMILKIGKRHDIIEVNSDVLNLISHGTQERLRGLLEKLTLIAQHRNRTYKGNEKYILSNDAQAQLRFLEQLDQAEKKKKDEEEKEKLLRAAKSRCNKEDPEQLRLKQKAKEMQQLELAQIQQREANRAALEALGPRKKRSLDSSISESGFKDLNKSSGLAKISLRPRITRICLRDLIFCLEQEKETKHSLVLYQALLK